ncbi:MAG: ester cyclase [Pseudomonadota bacterium]
MKGFSNRWADLPDYILGITQEIWEGRGIAALNHFYTEDVPVRTPMGIAIGNKAAMAATMETLNEFPDRQLLGEDVIWSGDEEAGFLSSHRILSCGTHTRDGQFGPATGKSWTIRVIADCAAKDDAIYDEWMVRDYGGLVRQLGLHPRDFAQTLLERSGGAASAVFRPENDVAGAYQGTGNDNAWGARYRNLLERIMDADFAAIHQNYDRAVIGEYAGSQQAVGREAAAAFWLSLRAAFPNATFTIHHVIGLDADMMSPRAAIRWSLDGAHEGWGSFGAPSGKRVHVMGVCHAEFGPYGPEGVGLRREYALYDEVAVWMQILAP